MAAVTNTCTNEHQHQHQNQKPQRNQAQRHVHQAYHRHLASRSAASSTSAWAQTSRFLVSEYRNTSGFIVILVRESQKTYDYVEAKEGMLFFIDMNASRAQAFRGLDYGEEDNLEAESGVWEVKREEKMTLTYWFLVWLVPALLLGIHELQGAG